MKHIYYAIHRHGDLFKFCMSENKTAVRNCHTAAIVTKHDLVHTDEGSIAFFKWENDWMARVNKLENAVDLTEW